MVLIRSPAYIMLLIGMALAPYNGFRAGRIVIVLADYFFIMAGIFFMLEVLFYRIRVIIPVSLFSGLVVLVLGYLMSRGAYNPAFDFVTMVDFLVLIYSWCFLPFVIMNLPLSNMDQARFLMNWWLGFTILGALVGILKSNGLTLPYFLDVPAGNSHRQAGLTAHPNMYGMFAAVVSPICLSFALAAKGTSKKLFWYGAFGCLGYAINLSGSRTALVSMSIAALGVVALYFLYYEKSINREIGRVALLLLAVLGYILAIGFDSETALGRLFRVAESATRSDMIRDQYLSILTEDFLNSPFLGNGYRTFRVHDTLIAVLATSGLVGLVGHLLRESGALGCVFGLMRELKGRPENFAISCGLVMAYCVWILTLSKEYALAHRQFFVLIGLIFLFYYSFSGKRVFSAEAR